MAKKFKVDRCCMCPFNDHGQVDRVPIMESYLGYNFREYFWSQFGGPQLMCMYDPKKNLRDNVRGRAWNNIYFIIWQCHWYDGTDIMFDFDKQPEFKEQLEGFPKRCPLEDDL